MSEEIVGSIAVNEFHRFRRNSAYALVLTDGRMLAVKASSPKDALLLAVAARIGKVPGATPVPTEAQGGDEETNETPDKERRPTIDTEVLLSADADNFELPYEEVFQVEMKRSGFGASGRRAGKMEILTYTAKRQFDLVADQMYDECVGVVRKVLGNRLLE